MNDISDAIPSSFQTVNLRLNISGHLIEPGPGVVSPSHSPVPIGVLSEGVVLAWDESHRHFWSVNTETGVATRLRGVPETLEAPQLCDLSEQAAGMYGGWGQRHLRSRLLSMSDV